MHGPWNWIVEEEIEIRIRSQKHSSNGCDEEATATAVGKEDKAEVRMSSALFIFQPIGQFSAREGTLIGTKAFM